MPDHPTCDVAIVGGGLAGALFAMALARRRPDVTLRLIERSDRIGGNHLWSFFASDIADGDRWLVAPLVSHGWTKYEVAFPAHRRHLTAPYYSIESHRLDPIVRAALPEGTILLDADVREVGPGHVALADGTRIDAGGVIDCRGIGDIRHLDLGYQKFVGQELHLAAPHDAPDPMVMDATVEQIDGYRFVYCLPFAADRMFVEDTYYSDTPDLPRPAGGANDDPASRRIADYAAARGWQVERVGRQETGVLPVAMGGDFEAYWRSGGAGVAKGGMRAGLFHPLTGYSLPDAVRAASRVAGARDLSGAALHTLLHDHAAETWAKRGFYRMLTTMLFRAADPDDRYRVLERFYRLDAGLIARFYAGLSTMFDRARVLTGKPPVPIGRAIRVLWENAR